MTRKKLLNAWGYGYAGPFYPKSMALLMELYDKFPWTIAELDALGKQVYGYKRHGNFKTTGNYYWFHALYFRAELWGLGEVAVVFPWAEDNKSAFLNGINPSSAIYYKGLGFLDMEKIAAQLTEAMAQLKA